MITARDHFSDKLRGQMVDPTHYLTKPVELKQLLQIVAQCVDKKALSLQP